MVSRIVFEKCKVLIFCVGLMGFEGFSQTNVSLADNHGRCEVFREEVSPDPPNKARLQHVGFVEVEGRGCWGGSSTLDVKDKAD